MSTKILYVEDDPSSRQAIKDVLEVYYDCKVELAVNGIEGVEKSLANHYGVIIMDIGLPDISGVEAARRIKKWNRHQPIVSSSGHAFSPEDMPPDAFDANFRKPFSHQLKEFEAFCASVNVHLVSLI